MISRVHRSGYTYEYRHRVTFEDTNLVGNVYYANHIKWQGRCRELFVREHAPALMDEIETGLAIVTTRCSCEYHQELRAFDEVVVAMRTGRVTPTTIVMIFDYIRVRDGNEELVATGEQRVAFMRRAGDELVPTPIPAVMRAALESRGVRVPG